ncbi:MAG: 50S ribosomal protein L29 [Methanobrevibacter sp.]|jgi:large subunit ribosomal protein L29|nr:50S ribosomal protein L29 [Methanobrevibacter sp.]
MAILRSKDIWEMDIENIQEKLDELKKELAKNISKSSAAGVNENPGKIRELKRTIACVITIMTQKQKER